MSHTQKIVSFTDLKNLTCGKDIQPSMLQIYVAQQFCQFLSLNLLDHLSRTRFSFCKKHHGLSKGNNVDITMSAQLALEESRVQNK